MFFSWTQTKLRKLYLGTKSKDPGLLLWDKLTITFYINYEYYQAYISYRYINSGKQQNHLWFCCFPLSCVFHVTCALSLQADPRLPCDAAEAAVWRGSRNFRVAGLVCLVWLAGSLASTCYHGLYLFFGIYICDLFCKLCIVFAVSSLELRLHQPR